MKPLPLEGIRVVEFSHMVMGPTCGLVLADGSRLTIHLKPRSHTACHRQTVAQEALGTLQKSEGVPMKLSVVKKLRPIRAAKLCYP